MMMMMMMSNININYKSLGVLYDSVRAIARITHGKQHRTDHLLRNLI